VFSVLTFGLALLPGLAAVLIWRGPRGDVEPSAAPPPVSLPEAAVLRDGALGATRWAFAALLVKLARDGHCTLVRTRKRKWVRTGPALTLDLHADPTGLSPLEETVLRQFGRHDTLSGFGFAGSTFRRRTLRDVRTALVERGWLSDRRRRANALLGLAVALLGTGVAVAVQGGDASTGALLFGGAVGSVVGAVPRFPVTEAGARRRAAHRAYAQQQRDRIRAYLPARPAQAWAMLVEGLPHLVLERRATPRWLSAVAGQFEAAGPEEPAPDWVQDEEGEVTSIADTCRVLAHVLRALGARTPLPERLGQGRGRS